MKLFPRSVALVFQPLMFLMSVVAVHLVDGTANNVIAIVLAAIHGTLTFLCLRRYLEWRASARRERQ